MTTLLKYSIGLDIAKKDFSACVSVIDMEQKVKLIASRKFNNDNQGLADFWDWVNKHCSSELRRVFLMEVTGVYYENLAWYLHKQGAWLSVVLANKAKKYLQGLGLKSKTDKIDSQGLSRMGAEQNHPQWQPIAESIANLRALTRQHENLQALKSLLNNQIHALDHSHFEQEFVREQLIATLALLTDQEKVLEKQLEKTIQADAELASKVANILLIKGVGLMTIATILAETQGFAHFENSAQVVSYAGYDVVQNQSGTIPTRISKQGNAHTRFILPSLECG